MYSTELLLRTLRGMFPPLFCVVDREGSNGLMPSFGELMMPSRRLIGPGVEHAMQVIGSVIISCRAQWLALRQDGYIVLQGSCIMNAPRIL